jgi:GntR family transcriptional regulator
VPYYFQLAELIEHEITGRSLAPGARLPSEFELCGRFGVSRTTVRQALASLEHQGLIRRQKGHGTFVDAPRPRSWLLQSNAGFFHEEVERLGRRVTSDVLRATRSELPVWACQALEVGEPATGATLERVRSVDGLVALYVVNHVPERFAEAVLAFNEGDGSLYARIASHDGTAASGGRRLLTGVSADDNLAQLLEVDVGFPLVFIDSVSWDAERRPFDCYHAWLRTDRMQIEVQVVDLTASTPALP